jgi:hypothetical protein
MCIIYQIPISLVLNESDFLKGLPLTCVWLKLSFNYKSRIAESTNDHYFALIPKNHRESRPTQDR